MQNIKRYFKKIHNRMEASLNRALRDYGLTGVQFDLMIYLEEAGESCSTLTDISAHFGVKHTSTIHVLKILEKKGFIEKSGSPDARAKSIMLTDKGRQIIAEVKKKEPSVSRVAFAGLSESELQTLEQILRKIYTNIESDEFRNL